MRRSYGTQLSFIRFPNRGLKSTATILTVPTALLNQKTIGNVLLKVLSLSKSLTSFKILPILIQPTNNSHSVPSSDSNPSLFEAKEKPHVCPL
jgi:hypothetical protein